jgi:hypothetical protein
MISTNLQAKLNLENAKPSKAIKVMEFFLMSVIALIGGYASGAFFKALEQSMKMGAM